MKRFFKEDSWAGRDDIDGRASKSCPDELISMNMNIGVYQIDISEECYSNTCSPSYGLHLVASSAIQSYLSARFSKLFTVIQYVPMLLSCILVCRDPPGRRRC